MTHLLLRMHTKRRIEGSYPSKRRIEGSYASWRMPPPAPCRGPREGSAETLSTLPPSSSGPAVTRIVLQRVNLPCIAVEFASRVSVLALFICDT